MRAFFSLVTVIFFAVKCTNAFSFVLFEKPKPKTFYETILDFVYEWSVYARESAYNWVQSQQSINTIATLKAVIIILTLYAVYSFLYEREASHA